MRTIMENERVNKLLDHEHVIILDISHLPDVREGEEVTIILPDEVVLRRPPEPNSPLDSSWSEAPVFVMVRAPGKASDLLDKPDWNGPASRKAREPLFRKRVDSARGRLTFTSVTALDVPTRRHWSVHSLYTASVSVGKYAASRHDRRS
jgi:hypothetical protein